MRTGGEQSCFDDNMAVEFFEGSLTDNEAAAVESHAAACEGCRMLLAALARSPSLEGDESGDSDEGMSPTLPAGGEAHVDLVQGTEVGRFVVLARIGRGGMGVVFAAYDPRLDRKVALKLLRNVAGDSDSAGEATTRLLREAQAIAQLSHPNVIQVYDVGTYKSEVYIAMEFVEGETLTSWLRRWVRPWEDILVKFREAGHALADAHASGMAHRDFKPDNVLVGTDERVRVMDFGLARSWFTDSITPDDPYGLLAQLSDEAVSALNNTLTKTGTLLGTPRYMAPEQFLGGGTDARADQFSFCVALYEALYRRHPDADSPARGSASPPRSGSRCSASPRMPCGTSATISPSSKPTTRDFASSSRACEPTTSESWTISRKRACAPKPSATSSSRHSWIGPTRSRSCRTRSR